MTRRSSPGRRRLRFSFQINDVKDPNRLCRPRRLAPGVGGGGYLVASVFRVNRLFRAFFSPPEVPVLKSVPDGRGRIRAQKSLRAAEGLPSLVRSDSIEGSEAIHARRKNQGLFEPLAFVAAPFPTGERRLYGPPFPVSIDLPNFLPISSSEDFESKRTASAAGGALRSSACR